MAGRQVAANAAYLAVLTIANYALGLLIFPYLSRVLSVESFGLFGFSMAFVVIFQVVVEYGFMISATASIARNRDNPTAIGKIVSTTMLAKAMLVIAALVGFLIIAQLVPMVRDEFTFVALFLMSAVITALLPDYYFRGVEKMRGVAIRAVISKLAALLVIMLLVKGDDQLYIAPVALAAGNLLALVLGFVAIFRAGVRLPTPHFRDALTQLRDGSGFFLSRVAASVNQAAGSFVLGLQVTPASVTMGQFAGASRISSAGELAVVPISDALYPHMVRHRDYKLFRRVYLVGLAAWFVGCLAVFIWAEQLCVLILGPQYAEAGWLLRILLIGAFMAYSSYLFGYPALTPLGLSGHANVALLVSATISVLAYFALWLTGSITVESICVVVATGNLTVFLYRFSVFMANRRKFDNRDASA